MQAAMKRAMFSFAEIIQHTQNWEEGGNIHTQSGDFITLPLS
jgi:hypothetical protein